MLFGANTVTDTIVQGGALGILGVIIVWVMRWAIPRFLDAQRDMVAKHVEAIDKIVDQQRTVCNRHFEEQRILWEETEKNRQIWIEENRRAHTAQMAILLNPKPDDPNGNGEKEKLLKRIEDIFKVGQE